mgnify:CR=1 FL=1|tara:strand:+ start:102 stop:446 length:345 start_codon:yes stop_codon:yes gene_type:complete
MTDVIMHDAETTSARYNPPISHYAEIKCDLTKDLVRKLIGKNGYFFNVITKASKVKYLWYDNLRKVIEIWGPMSCIAEAKNRLSDRMQRILKESQHDTNDSGVTHAQDEIVANS